MYIDLMQANYQRSMYLQSRTNKDIKKNAQWKCFCTSAVPFCVPRIWGAECFCPGAADRGVPFKERKVNIVTVYSSSCTLNPIYVMYSKYVHR